MTTLMDVVFSAVTAFAIVTGGCFITLIGSQPAGSGAVNKTAWALAILAGLAAAGKDVRASLKLPPVTAVSAVPAATVAVAK